MEPPANPDAQLDLFRTSRPPRDLARCYWDYCPNCAQRLHNDRCKYRCPRCHYFMSCSDFD